MKDTAGLRGQRGFTLSEVLVSLGILAVIVSAVLGGLHFGHRAWEIVPALEERDASEAAARAVSEILENTYPARVADTRQLGALVFAGRSDDLTFVTLSEGETQFGGLILMRLGVDNGPKGKVLRLWTDVFRPQAAWASAVGRVASEDVIDGVTSLRIEYFGPSVKSASDSWQSEWLDRDRLPKMISLQITGQHGARRYALPVIVALRQS